MKVLWLTNIPSPYRVDFFNELGKYCDLTVIFEKKSSDERDESWKNLSFDNFTPVFLKGKAVRVDSALSFEVLKYIKKGKYDILAGLNYSSPTMILAMEKAMLLKLPYTFVSDGSFVREDSFLKGFIKRRYIKGAASILSSGEYTNNTLIHYGASKERIFNYPLTSLFENDILKASLSYDEK